MKPCELRTAQGEEAATDGAEERARASAQAPAGVYSRWGWFQSWFRASLGMFRVGWSAVGWDSLEPRKDSRGALGSHPPLWKEAQLVAPL